MPTHLHEQLVPSSGQEQIEVQKQHQQHRKKLAASTPSNSDDNNNDNSIKPEIAIIRPEQVEYAAIEIDQSSPEDDEDKVNPVSLDRRFSAPARFKSITRIEVDKQQDHHRNNLDHEEDNDDEEYYDRSNPLARSQTLETRHKIVGNDNSSYSQVTIASPSSDGYRKHLRNHHKSASPLSGSSSASDSAFSQSRSTLGSKTGSQKSSNSCFISNDNNNNNNDSFTNGNNVIISSGQYQPLIPTKPKSTTIINAPKTTTLITKSNDLNNGIKHPYQQFQQLKQILHNDDHNQIKLSQNVDNFQIVWRNLSYQVPRKGLSKLKARIFKHFKGDNRSNNDSLVDYQIGNRVNHQNQQNVATLKQRRIIFSNLNGCVQSGQLTAILGPSGAGKTTFLKCLTNSIVDGVSGSIDINGSSATSHHLKLCIIPQKDYLFDNLTVMENLLFASRIKNTKSNVDHMANVNRVAGLLGLQACMKLKTSKLSGGQYKRVSIAQELLSQPDILILDEPTSGLDSLTCFKTVSVLRDLVNLSQAGLMPPLAIVMTIHQPQIKIFNQFHHVYILSSMGQCVYEGKPEYLVDTVNNCCNLLPPPDDQNAASFIIDLGSEVYGTEPIEQLVNLQRENFLLIHSKCDNLPTNNNGNISNNRVDECNNHINKSAANHFKQMLSCSDLEMEQSLNNNNCHHIPSVDDPPNGELRISERLRKRNNHENSFWLHTGLLIKRLWISMWRDSLLATTRISFHLIIPFVFYFVYSHKSGAANGCPHVEREIDIRDMVSDTNIQRLATQHDELILTFENVSLFFLLLYSFSMCVLAVTALSFPLNMQILLKETSNGWYTMPRFVMAKTLADLPMEMAMPVISVSLAYAITGQPSSYLCWRMLTVTTVMTLCSLISQTQGLLFGAYFMNNVQAAVFVSQASTLPWILLSGFTTRVSELPKVLQWLSFGSIYRLGIESIVAVRYGFGTCPCDDELINDRPAKIIGIPDQLKSVMSYYMDMYAESSNIANSTVTNNDVNVTNSTKIDIFERLATTMSRANTYGVDILSCHDVRPFIMSAREVDETILPTFLTILVSVLVTLKILLFYVVRIRTG